MKFQENVPLSRYSTMRLGGKARYLTLVYNKQELEEAVKWGRAKSLPIIMIGEGSNIIWSDEGFNGLVLVNKLSNFKMRKLDDKTAEFTLGSGEVWDAMVAKTVDMGYSGIEFLSLIPGTVGGTPVQNVGAYGREIKEVLISVEAYDVTIGKFVTILGKDCGFAYRSSRFKTTDKNRFFITAIKLELAKANPLPPFYDSLTRYFNEHGINKYSPKIVREAVIAVRTKKLPDPDVVANNGSFFANPIISSDQFAGLEIKFPSVVHWRIDKDNVKLSAAWLIEQAGFGHFHDRETGMATWDKQALVLINEHARKTADLLKFRDRIIAGVHAKFGVKLEQEPELI